MKIKNFVKCILLSTVLSSGIGNIDVVRNDMTASLWEDINMPELSYFAGFGFAAPTDKGLWTKAKQNAMSGKQVLLEQVLKVVHTPLIC
jgi:hypothetical protein